MYDHTDALRSPMMSEPVGYELVMVRGAFGVERKLLPTPWRMRAAHRMVTIDPEIGFKVDSRLLRPAESTFHTDPHTRVGY